MRGAEPGREGNVRGEGNSRIREDAVLVVVVKRGIEVRPCTHRPFADGLGGKRNSPFPLVRGRGFILVVAKNTLRITD